MLPLVNKALVYAAAHQDFQQATALCVKALEIDPRCEVAIQQVAQFKLQASQMKEAVEWYGKGVEVAMTEMGLGQFLQFEAAAKAQRAFVAEYPEVSHIFFDLISTPKVIQL